MAERKMTANELKRNAIYDTISGVEFEGFTVLGNVKQGLLMEGNETGKHVVVKVILKKAKVDFEAESIERLTEQVEDAAEDVKDAEDTDSTDDVEDASEDDVDAEDVE